MLVLSRKVGEKIQIGSDIEVTVVDISRKRIRLGITLHIPVHREEVFQRIHGSREPTSRRDLCVFRSDLQFLKNLFAG